MRQHTQRFFRRFCNDGVTMLQWCMVAMPYGKQRHFGTPAKRAVFCNYFQCFKKILSSGLCWKEIAQLQRNCIIFFARNDRQTKRHYHCEFRKFKRKSPVIKLASNYHLETYWRCCLFSYSYSIISGSVKKWPLFLIIGLFVFCLLMLLHFLKKWIGELHQLTWTITFGSL